MIPSKVYSDREWRKEARLIIRGEMARREVGYKELARRLGGIGVEFEWKSLSNKISRGTFSAVFFLQCLHVLGVEQVHFNR